MSLATTVSPPIYSIRGQVGLLFRLLRKLPHVAQYYLYEFVFPVTCRHQGLKLSACGQALGGELLFRQRFGFSGTPSDLLPVELGRCHYERGSDGMPHTPHLLSARRSHCHVSVSTPHTSLSAVIADSMIPHSTLHVQ